MRDLARMPLSDAAAKLGWFRRFEWPVLLILLIAAGSIWAFVELADEVIEGATDAFDRRILLTLRNAQDPTQPLGPAWFQEMMRDFTALGSTGVLVLVTAGAAGFLFLEGKRRAALAVILSVLGGMLISQLVKMGLDRPRPDLVPHATVVYTASFPSGHSMMATAVYLTLGALVARTRRIRRVKVFILVIAVLVSLLVGVSRVYLGVHWPTDVLAGWAVGAAWALLCWVAMLWLQVHGNVERDNDQPTDS